MNGFHKLIRNLSCTAMCSLQSSHLCLNSMEKQTSDFPFSVKKSQKRQGGRNRDPVLHEASDFYCMHASFHSICKPAFMMPYKILSDVLLFER